MLLDLSLGKEAGLQCSIQTDVRIGSLKHGYVCMEVCDACFQYSSLYWGEHTHKNSYRLVCFDAKSFRINYLLELRRYFKFQNNSSCSPLCVSKKEIKDNMWYSLNHFLSVVWDQGHSNLIVAQYGCMSQNSVQMKTSFLNLKLCNHGSRDSHISLRKLAEQGLGWNSQKDPA